MLSKMLLDVFELLELSQNMIISISISFQALNYFNNLKGSVHLTVCSREISNKISINIVNT